MKRLSYYKFRLAILEKFVEEVNLVKPSPAEQTASHFPKRIIEKNEKGKVMTKQCKVCYQKNVGKDTVPQCPQCPDARGLCIEKCFEASQSVVLKFFL